MFFGPVIVLFWQSKGLSMTQIFLLQSIYSIGVSILELPTGAFADYFGKKKSLILGALFFTVGCFWYGLSSSFWQFVIGELTCGVGGAFISGADRAFIHQALREEGNEDNFRRVEGKARGIIQIAQAVGNIGGSIIGSFSLGLTLIASGFSGLIAFFVSLTFNKARVEKTNLPKLSYPQIIKESFLLIKNNRSLLWLTLFFTIFNGLVWLNIWFAQPYLKMMHIPIIYFGTIFACFSIICALGTTMTHWYEKIFREKAFLVFGIISVGIMLTVSLFPNIYVFFTWSLLNTFIFMNQTIVSDKVLKIIPHNKAATVFSFHGLSRRTVYAVFAPVLGLVADRFGIRMATQTLAVTLFVLLAVLFIYKKQTRLKI